MSRKRSFIGVFSLLLGLAACGVGANEHRDEAARLAVALSSDVGQDDVRGTFLLDGGDEVDLDVRVVHDREAGFAILDGAVSVNGVHHEFEQEAVEIGLDIGSSSSGLRSSCRPNKRGYYNCIPLGGF